jgi:hypothetical protein
MTLCETGVEVPTAVVCRRLGAEVLSPAYEQQGLVRRAAHPLSPLRRARRRRHQGGRRHVGLTEVAAVAEAPDGVEAAVIAGPIPSATS